MGTERLLLTIPEVVETTGYSRSFIYQRISSGDLKVVRMGRTVRVTADEVRDWVSRAGDLGAR